MSSRSFGLYSSDSMPEKSVFESEWDRLVFFGCDASPTPPPKEIFVPAALMKSSVTSAEDHPSCFLRDRPVSNSRWRRICGLRKLLVSMKRVKVSEHRGRQKPTSGRENAQATLHRVPSMGSISTNTG